MGGPYCAVELTFDTKATARAELSPGFARYQVLRNGEVVMETVFCKVWTRRDFKKWVKKDDTYEVRALFCGKT